MNFWGGFLSTYASESTGFPERREHWMEEVQSKRVRPTQLNRVDATPRLAGHPDRPLLFRSRELLLFYFDQDDDDGEACLRASVSPVSSPADSFGIGDSPGRP